MQQLCFIGLVWLAATGGAWGASIPPLSAVGGPVPPIAGGYETWPADPLSIADLTDGSTATGVTLTGKDNFLQDNGARVDFGTFYLLRYELPQNAPAFRIEFTGAVQYPGGAEEFVVNAINRDGINTRTVLFTGSMSQPGTFDLAFYRGYNDGSEGVWGQAWGLDEMQQPDGTISLLVQGSYLGQLNRPGFVTSTLYEVTAKIVPAPEPRTAILLGIGAAAVVALGRRRR